MGSSFSSASSSGDESNSGTPVLLNVYDLTPLNNYFYWCGLGIFHSGIEVHGLEYGFGAHDFPTTGVFEVEPRNCPGFIYRCSIQLGYINMSSLEFRTFMESMAAEYNGDAYHLISKNCNHFTEDMSLKLTGNQIPGWINRLAGLGAACNCLLPESLRLPSAKQIPEYYALSDGSESVAFINSHEPMDSDDTDQDRFLLSQQAKSYAIHLEQNNPIQIDHCLLIGKGDQIVSVSLSISRPQTKDGDGQSSRESVEELSSWLDGFNAGDLTRE